MMEDGRGGRSSWGCVSTLLPPDSEDFVADDDEVSFQACGEEGQKTKESKMKATCVQLGSPAPEPFRRAEHTAGRARQGQATRPSLSLLLLTAPPHPRFPEASGCRAWTGGGREGRWWLSHAIIQEEEQAASAAGAREQTHGRGPGGRRPELLSKAQEVKLQFEQHREGPQEGHVRSKQDTPVLRGQIPPQDVAVEGAQSWQKSQNWGLGRGAGWLAKPQDAAYAELALGAGEGTTASTVCRGWGGHLHIAPRYQGQPSAWVR